jgi:LysR family cyn operon transcriptional activator
MKYPDQQIRSFTKIAELKSLTGAAEALDLSQSGLSKQLQQLEKYLGQSLFNRTGRGVSLTAAGEKLYAVAITSYGALDHTITQLKTTEGVTQGALRIATVHTLSTYFIPGLLGAFLAQRPQVSVSLLGRSSPEVVELVESGKVDIGFVYDVAVTSNNVTSFPLFNEEMMLFHGAAPGVADAGADLRQANLALVCFPAHYALRRMLNHAPMRYQVVAEVETVDAMLKLVMSGLGSCILPDRMPHDLIEGRGLVRTPISSPTLRRRVVGIVKSDRPASALIELLLAIASKQTG